MKTATGERLHKIAVQENFYFHCIIGQVKTALGGPPYECDCSMISPCNNIFLVTTVYLGIRYFLQDSLGYLHLGYIRKYLVCVAQPQNDKKS